MKSSELASLLIEGGKEDIPWALAVALGLKGYGGEEIPDSEGEDPEMRDVIALGQMAAGGSGQQMGGGVVPASRDASLPDPRRARSPLLPKRGETSPDYRSSMHMNDLRRTLDTRRRGLLGGG